MTSIPQLTRRPGAPRSARRAATPATTNGNGLEKWTLPLAIVAAAVIGLAGWMVLVSPVRSDTAAVTSQADVVDTRVAQLRTRVEGLEADQAKLPRYRQELAAAAAALPTTAALPAFLRMLQDLGTSTGTVVTALDATEPDGSTGGARTGAGGVGAVYAVPITVSVRGDYDALTAFVTALQTRQPRAVLVDSVTEKAATGSSVTLTVAMTAFVAPTAGAAGNGG
ncbi:type 4a pilus biogenesis protein PilO [Jatrophihabitans sp. YIM 134969]